MPPEDGQHVTFVDLEGEFRVAVTPQLVTGGLDPDTETLDEAKHPHRLGESGVPVVRDARLTEVFGIHMP